jgi:hypothetical protein
VWAQSGKLLVELDLGFMLFLDWRGVSPSPCFCKSGI